MSLCIVAYEICLVSISNSCISRQLSCILYNRVTLSDDIICALPHTLEVVIGRCECTVRINTLTVTVVDQSVELVHLDVWAVKPNTRCYWAHVAIKLIAELAKVCCFLNSSLVIQHAERSLVHGARWESQCTNKHQWKIYLLHIFFLFCKFRMLTLHQ